MHENLMTRIASGGRLRTLVQLLKFGISGILGVVISTVLFYGLKGRLPDLFWTILVYRLDMLEICWYVVTSCIGGTVHFILSKVWVFEIRDRRS
jgi:putative flippase GtrA